MKNFLIGLIAGAIFAGAIFGGSVIMFGPSNLFRSSKEKANEAVSYAEQKKYDFCRKNYLQSSNCYQFATDVVCEANIADECGQEPESKRGKK